MNAISIIKSLDQDVIADLYKSDEQAMIVLYALSGYVDQYYPVNEEITSVLIEITRVIYYLGYKRANMLHSMPDFVEGEV